MSGAEIASIVGVCLIGLGLIMTWRHNGRSQAEQFGGLKTDVKNIQSSLDSPDCGLGALSNKIAEFKTHCAKVSTTLSMQVKSHEKAIDEMKKERDTD